jgi:hypothetical protein
MACETCKGKDAHAPESVPYIVHESSMARMERQIKRLWIALIVAIIVAVVAPLTVHFGWLNYESQFETYEYTQDGEGTNIIGDGNDVDNGAEIADQEEEETE